MHAFCTVAYSPLGLAMALTLQRSLGRRLHVLVRDEAEARLLDRLAPSEILAVPQHELEAREPGLAAVRDLRTATVYAWTSKPPWCLDVLARTGAGAVTFLDVDQRFYADPVPILDDELAGVSVALLPHRHRPEHAVRDRWAGRFNAGWATFRADEEGLAALRWWRERTIEYCPEQPEEGGFGDQVHLDHLARRFGGARAIAHPGIARAPWSDQSTLRERRGAPEVEGRPLVSYHFQSLRLERSARTGRSVWRTYRGHRVGEDERRLLWRPYVAELAGAVREITALSGTPYALPRLTLAGAAREWRRHLWILAKDHGWR